MELIQNTEQTLNQLIELVRSVKSEEYSQSLEILSGSTIGQHVRHIAEFYMELDNGYATCEVCYDNRKRKLELETQPASVIDQFGQIISCIRKYDMNRDLLIKTNHNVDSEEQAVSKSSISRELVYALDHTIHHLAIIKIAIQVEFPNIQLSKNIGVAPSTVRNTESACAQ